MPKVMIDVDLGELGSEWEAVAFRVPKVGEVFVGLSGCAQTCESDDWKCPKLLIRRKIVWPSWCAAAAICKDQSGVVFAYAKVPSRGCSSWSTDGYWSVLDPRIVDFQLPDDWDWTIPIINPNYKESSGI